MNLNHPDFYILGAAKSGTTSLWHYLNSHPEIFMSNPKEPNFMVFEDKKLPPFSGPCSNEYLMDKIYNNTITDLSSYRRLFDKCDQGRLSGEASVRYLYFKEAAINIEKYTPEAKFIIILRNPVDRLYSHYCMMRRYALEPLELMHALDAEDKRKSLGWGWDWHYKSVSLYGEQIERYYERFSSEQFKIIFYEEFKSDTNNKWKEICNFLEISNEQKLTGLESQNIGSIPKNYKLHHWLKQENNKQKLKKIIPQKLYFKSIQLIESINNQSIPVLDKNTRESIMQFFKDDITKLEDTLREKIPWS